MKNKIAQNHRIAKIITISAAAENGLISEVIPKTTKN